MYGFLVGLRFWFWLPLFLCITNKFLVLSLHRYWGGFPAFILPAKKKENHKKKENSFEKKKLPIKLSVESCKSSAM